MKATPFRASHRRSTLRLTFRAGMPYLLNGNVTCATTRLSFDKASAIPPLPIHKLLILKLVRKDVPKSHLEFCSPAIHWIQVLGGSERTKPRKQMYKLTPASCYSPSARAD